MDFEVINHGSIIILLPLSAAATDWTDTHLPDDAPMFAGGYAVEPRYLPPILEGIESDGLIWQ